MWVERLWLNDYRNYRQVELAPAADGLSVVVGANAQGKTNLLEAIGYLATLASFRGAPRDSMIRQGCDRATVRAQAVRAGRPVLVEAELSLTGRDRAQVNRQPLRRARDLLGALQVTVFSPDDLTLVKGGPGERRRFLDDVLVALHPRHDATRGDLERILRQRATLLKQAGGRVTPDIVATLDVWDTQLARVGEAMVAGRRELLARLAPAVALAYAQVAGEGPGPAGPGGHQQGPTLCYQPSWRGPLAEALARGRHEDLRRGVTTVGPHRDDLAIHLAGLASRTHASQGEQRGLALALRLGAHVLIGEELGEPPVLLLDDVFSELDPQRSAALLAHLPPGQAILTTAGGVPPQARPASVVRVESGRLMASARGEMVSVSP